MEDVGGERKDERKNDKYKFAFVFTSAALAVCCAMLILLLINKNAKNKISVINYSISAVSENESDNCETAETDSDVPHGKIDLNTCTARQLCAIPGIGEKTAEKILEYRETAGGFDSVDELINVNGIGEVKLEKMRQYVTVNGK